MEHTLSEQQAQDVLDLIQWQRKSVRRLRQQRSAERILKLKKLKQYLMSHQEELCAVMAADFRKPAAEVLLAEVLSVKMELDHAISHLKQWMEPKSVPTPMSLLGTKSHVHIESKGSSLIIAPWNYPFSLAIGPLIFALSAGCPVIIKPSELSPNTSGFIKQMISNLFDRTEVAVLEGDASMATFLLDQKFDHIFFTGSPAIGKYVMAAAAKHLSSVTLELGGKSPAIVHASADLPSAAAKIAWGKFVNNGQTCIAPDYLLVQESVYLLFIEQLETAIKKHYGERPEDRAQSKDLARMVNLRHFKRVQALLEEAKEQGAAVLFGGEQSEADLYLAPTLLHQVQAGMRIMQEEIFGPILPILPFKDAEEVIAGLEAEEKPLSLYVFAKDQEFSQQILDQTSSGTAVVNDCLLQFSHPDLPFGGVNHSGIGKTKGYYGFLEFSNQKSVLVQKTNFMRFIYPPYGKRVAWLIERFVRWM